MTRRALFGAGLGLLVALMVSIAVPAGASTRCHAAYYRYSENGTRQYVQASEIVASGTSCRTARSIARRYGASYRRHYGADRTVLRYWCGWERRGSDVGLVRCHVLGRDSLRIRFAIYDSSPFH